MKRLLIFIVSWPMILLGQVPCHYEIAGQITKAEGKQLYLTQRGMALDSNEKIILLDSCKVIDGRFLFKGTINEPNYYSLFVESQKSWKPFILGNSKLTFSGDADSIWTAIVSGSKDNTKADSLYKVLRTLVIQQNKVADSIGVARKNNDITNAKRLFGIYEPIMNQKLLIIKHFIKSNSDCFESLIQLKDLVNNISKNDSKNLFDFLSEDLKKHSIGKELQYQLFDLDSVTSNPMSFSQPDTSGKLISVESVKGDYLLIEFWASWCAPCRKETPIIKIAYDTYKNKGFEIIAISLDSNKRSWIDAIKKDNMTWIQVSDLKGVDNDVAKKYGIKPIPANFLLDKDRRIIATNLSGEDLLNKLKELYK